MSARTIYSILRDTAQRQGSAPALHQPAAAGGYRSYSWQEYLQAAEEIAAGLRTLGIVKGDVVALASEARAEFYLTDFGIIAAGAVAAAVYTAYPPPELVRVIQACGARVLIAETPELLDRIAGAPGFPQRIQCVVMNGTSELAQTLDDLRARGRQTLASDPALVQRLQADLKGADPAILYLTSGATGDPKMALVSHEAVVSNLDMAPQVLDLGPRDSMLVFLPPAHITQRLVGEMLPAYCGMPVWFAESLFKLSQDMQRVKPTMFVAPPRLWERAHASVLTEIRKRPRVIQRWFEHSVELGKTAFKARHAGLRLPLMARLKLALADRLLFRKVRARCGGHFRICASGSAPLGRELAEFFLAVGFPFIEGYGLTEGGVVVIDRPGAMRPGSIGKAMPGVELRVAGDGELLVRSPTLFSGYYKDPRATAEVLRNGWLHTGDLAEIDSDGYVWITGRKKELIVLSNGRKISPARIETLFQTEPAVSHVLLVGDGRPFITALITATDSARERDVRAAVARVNAKLAVFEQIRKFEVLDRDFTIDAGELTATLKVRRSPALEHFRERAERLYARVE
jgi:long-chain acyl-CoA synthetase